jgi:glycosyltransferase involved in cell wall biosynthesis
MPPDRKPRIGVYPEVNQDGIGTYVRALKDRLGVEIIPCPVGILSPRQFLRPLPAGFDLIHVPHFVVPFNRRGCKVVCTIQDVTPVVAAGSLGYLKEKYLRFRIGWSIRKADHVIFTSENTLRDVRRLFGLPRQYSVIPLAMDTPVPETEIPRLGHPFPYYFTVGRRRKTKNTEGILRAFAKAAPHTQCHLVFGGKEDIHDARWKALAESLGIAERVHFTGFLTRERLAAYYREAVCLLFPSLYEGFGLPILEAMSYGCPVVTSNCASMPEVAGGAALLVDPADTAGMARELLRLETETGLRADLTAGGYANCAKYSWEKTGEATASVYRKTLGVA